VFKNVKLLEEKDIPISEYKRFHIAIHGMYEWGDGFKVQEAVNTYDLFWKELCRFGEEHKLHSEISDMDSRLLKADKYGFDKTDIFVHPMELVGYATEGFIREITDFINQNALCIEKGISADANVIRDVSSLSDKEYRELLISHSKEIVEAVKNEIANCQPKDVYNFVKSGFGMDFAREARIDRVGDKSGIGANDTDVMVVNNIIDTALALGAFNKEIASRERQVRREIELQQKMQAQMDPVNMINSTRTEVRCEAARKGYGLDKLIDDKSYKVRAAVAQQGYGLDKLVNDKYSEVRIAVVEQGYGLDKLVEDKNIRVRIAVAKQGYRLDKLVEDENYHVRVAVAEQGYGLDKLVNDKDWCVRVAVAEQGYGLDKLLDDKHYWVRMEVAKQGYGLDKLVNDEDYHVREAVAKQGYGLDKLIDDECKWVREAVAKQGYGLDKLVDDENYWVRDAVNEYLEDNEYGDMNEWKKDNPDKTYYKNNKSRGKEKE